MKNKYYLLLSCFGAIFNVSAMDIASEELVSLKEKINHAITTFEKTERRFWSYEVSRYEDEEGDISSSIEQHSPQDNEQWLLKRINGKKPTKKQLKHFDKKKQKQSNTMQQGENIQFKLRQLINEASLSLLSHDEKYIVMEFSVHLNKLGKDSIGKLNGKLFYKKDQKFIEKISIWNKVEFSPLFTANITDLAITITFVNINGAILVKQNEMMMKGSFAYFSEINETSLDTFSNYLYQGKAIP